MLAPVIQWPVKVALQRVGPAAFGMSYEYYGALQSQKLKIKSQKCHLDYCAVDPFL